MREVDVCSLQFNPFTLIGGEWWLITAGNEQDGYNTMTASWGHLGTIWGRPGRKAHMGLPTAVVYVRPQRYTKQFMDKEEVFTLSVFDESYRNALSYLGSHSGRDSDKVAEAGLTAVFHENTVSFAEAKMVFVCRKVYQASLKEEGFVDRDLVEINYPNRDFHDMYVGEIVKAYVND